MTLELDKGCKQYYRNPPREIKKDIVDQFSELLGLEEES
jgi:hypothetical protein